MGLNIYFEDYSDNSFVIYGETKPYKDEIKALGGKWNSNLKVGPGWIFSNKNKSTAHTWFNGKINKVVPEYISKPVSDKELDEIKRLQNIENSFWMPKTNSDMDKQELLDTTETKKDSIELSIQSYSDKSFVVRGKDTKIVKDKLKELGGKWNSNLKDGGGWIFTNKNKKEVEDWIINL